MTFDEQTREEVTLRTMRSAEPATINNLRVSSEREDSPALPGLLGRHRDRPRAQTVPTRSRVALERWEGVVLKVLDDDGFVARLSKGSFALAPDEEAEFDLEEVSDHDRPLVSPGARFYWSVGYETLPWGQRQRFSEIRLRRDPPLTQDEVDAARNEADRTADALGFADPIER